MHVIKFGEDNVYKKRFQAKLKVGLTFYHLHQYIGIIRKSTALRKTQNYRCHVQAYGLSQQHRLKCDNEQLFTRPSFALRWLIRRSFLMKQPEYMDLLRRYLARIVVYNLHLMRQHNSLLVETDFQHKFRVKQTIRPVSIN